MKKYHIEYIHGICTLYNDDAKPIFNRIQFKSFTKNNSQHWSVYIFSADKTIAIREKFNPFYCAIGLGESRYMFGYEELVNQESMSPILSFIKIIQQIDSIPLSAFKEIMAIINFDFSSLFNRCEIIKLADAGDLAAAVNKALEEYLKGDDSIFTDLASHAATYLGQEAHCTVLAGFPRNHPDFKHVNHTLHSIMLKQPMAKNPEDAMKALEKMFCYAKNAGLYQDAASYFLKLSDCLGDKPFIEQFKDDDATLLAIARKLKEQNNELNEFRTFKAGRNSMTLFPQVNSEINHPENTKQNSGSENFFKNK